MRTKLKELRTSKTYVMKLPSLIAFVFLISIANVNAQFYGPNDPTQQANVGTGNLWLGPGTAFASDNVYTTVGVGNSSNLQANGYGFNLGFWDNISGIQLDIERRVDLGNDISLVQAWADGELSIINNYNLPLADNRMMIVFVGVENGDEPIINDVTYAGQSMIKATGFSYATSFWARLECWYLPEASLATIPLGSHDIEVTYDPVNKTRFFDILSAAVFNNVDQSNPFLSFEEKGQNGGGGDSQLNTPIAAQVGGMYLTGIFCGNNTNPNSVNGGTNTFQINSGFTEGTDVYREDYTPGNGGVGTGGCLQTAYKIPATTGTEDPVFTFNGNPNRRLMIGIGLRKIGVLDTEVQLQKVGLSVGNNYAQTNVAWPNIDTYVSYGGPLDMWGTTWNYLDVNDNQFGSILKVNVINGTAVVDHKRITIFTTNLLPVELVDFFAERTDGRNVTCNWITATEHNNSHFLVERSIEGSEFEVIGTVEGMGNSTSLNSYEFIDDNAPVGLCYYRLKQVDFNGDFQYSEMRAVNHGESFEISVYPNPATNWANITSCSDCESIYIVNSMGEVIDFQEGVSFEEGAQFNLSNESDGTYFIVINNKNGEHSVQKLVKHSKSN